MPTFGPRMVYTRCGIVGADARPNWREQSTRESLTGLQQVEPSRKIAANHPSCNKDLRHVKPGHAGDAGDPSAVSVPTFGPRMVYTRCGIVGADARPNWREQSTRESLTGRAMASLHSWCGL